MEGKLRSSPISVGIKAFELYFPKIYVEQKELEEYDKVTPGKYTIGLGQEEMGFCSVQEDIASISMTVLSKLLKNYEIEPHMVGFLSVGTETLIDKSKGVKTQLMDLFGENTDIEGVDVKNACYGGTQALFHAIDWVYANWSFTGKYAIVVMGDIAIYEEGPARCTGGVGAFACLVAPNALISFEQGTRAVHMCNEWDFYKPTIGPASEYAVVDGPKSLKCYFNSLDIVYERYIKKMYEKSCKRANLTHFDAVFLHSPFSRHVRKSFGRMMLADFNRDSSIHADKSEFFEKARRIAAEEGNTSRDFATCVISGSEDLWKIKCEPYQYFNRRIGNIYTSSLYAQLVAFFYRCQIVESLTEKRLLFFSYGSGAASALFSAVIYPKHLPDFEAKKQFDLLKQSAYNATTMLEQRTRLSVSEYVQILKERETLMLGNVPYELDSMKSAERNRLNMFPETYYLERIDEKYRRFYSQIKQ